MRWNRCCCLLTLGCLLTLAFSGPAWSGTTFTDVTLAAGVDYLQHAPPAEVSSCLTPGCEVDRMTGGAAVADVDGDRWIDLLVTRLDGPSVLLRNRGDGTFEDISAASGIGAFDIQGNGALFGDIDNDGDQDLLVTVIGVGGDAVNDQNLLFINDGQGHFTEEAVARGAAMQAPGARLTYSAAFGDFDRDGWLDLKVVEWGFSAHARLLRNRGDEAPGFFEDVTELAGVDDPDVDGFAPAFVDLDDDGHQDLAIAADFGSSRLFWNDGAGGFTDGTIAAGVGTDENGMGSTFGDFDGDGDLDWFVTSIFDPFDTCSIEQCGWGPSGNRLFRNDGGRVFTDATDFAGVRDGGWGWGAAFFDMDNDTDLDLVMTNGVDFPGVPWEDRYVTDPMRLWENDGTGRMTEVSATSGVGDTASGKGLLVFDYDRDGDLDLFVVNNAGGPRLYRNDLPPDPTRHLRVHVRGNGGTNRDGYGARVSVFVTETSVPQVREIGVGSHFLGQSEIEAHFGLPPGVSAVDRVEVFFPATGTTVVRSDAPAGGYIWVNEREKCGLLGIEALVPIGVWALRGRRAWRSHGSPRADG